MRRRENRIVKSWHNKFERKGREADERKEVF
jgi:hypothetical protein